MFRCDGLLDLFLTSSISQEGEVSINKDENMIKLSTGQALTSVVVIFLVSALITYGAVAMYPADTEPAAEDVVTQAENYHELQEAVATILDEHVDEAINAEKLIQGAVRGAVEAAEDRYTTYFDTSELEDFTERIEGEYSGIGASILSVDDYVTVLVPFDGSPAATTPFEGATEDDPVGLQPGDKIVEVDGIDVRDMSADHVADIIRGPEGSEVVVDALRSNDDDEERLRFEFERARIEIPTAETDIVDEDIGVLSINQFHRHTPDQVREALDDLEAENISGIIIDLRFNPGGDLSAVVEVADFFVPEGPVMSAHTRDEEETLRAETPGYDLPIVVLVNEFSASGAEILAGAIRDRLGYPLVGEQTFGKGSVQRMVYLDDEEQTGMKLTTARFLTPDGHKIDVDGGLLPDYEVELPEDAELGELENDPQLQRAVQQMRILQSE